MSRLRHNLPRLTLITSATSNCIDIRICTHTSFPKHLCRHIGRASHPVIGLLVRKRPTQTGSVTDCAGWEDTNQGPTGAKHKRSSRRPVRVTCEVNAHCGFAPSQIGCLAIRSGNGPANIPRIVCHLIDCNAGLGPSVLRLHVIKIRPVILALVIEL